MSVDHQPYSESMSLFSWSGITTILLGILIWEFTKRCLWFVYDRCSTRAKRNEDNYRQDTKSFNLGVQIPDEPHVEIAVQGIGGAPCGLQWSNPTDFWHFENDNVSCTHICFHPPHAGGNNEGPEGMNYADYFKGKTRMWEIRLQFRFKTPPRADQDLYYGIQMDEFSPTSMATKQAQNMILAAIRHAAGGVYHSAGDDPSKNSGELERPACVLPLWGFDQYIMTPEGEKPPSLADPNFPSLGSKRYKRFDAYVKEVSELVKHMKKGETYTFSSWGISRFLDILSWSVVGIPIVTPIDINTFINKPPMHLVFYALDPEPEDEQPNSKGTRTAQPKTKRHLDSLKTMYIKATMWSSLKRPERSHVEALTGLVGAEVASSLDEGIDGGSRRGIRRRLRQFWQRDVVEPWQRDVVEPWQRGVVEPWQRDVVEPWQRQVVGPWERDVVEPWKRHISGPTEQFFKNSACGRGSGSCITRTLSGESSSQPSSPTGDLLPPRVAGGELKGPREALAPSRGLKPLAAEPKAQAAIGR